MKKPILSQDVVRIILDFSEVEYRMNANRAFTAKHLLKVLARVINEIDKLKPRGLGPYTKSELIECRDGIIKYYSYLMEKNRVDNQPKPMNGLVIPTKILDAPVASTKPGLVVVGKMNLSK